MMLTPQPVGIFPLPASYLVLAETEDPAGAYQQLMQGKIPPSFPPAWQFYQFALDNQLSEACAALATDNSDIARYNRFVLQSSPEQYEELRSHLTGYLRDLLEVVVYTLGYTTQPPQADNLTGETLALVLAAQVNHFVETGDTSSALERLTQAIDAVQDVSPIFAALLKSTRLEMERAHSDAHIKMIPQYRQVLQALHPTDLHTAKAEAWLNLGITYQELSNGQAGSLMEASKCYQQALKVFTFEGHPEQYALAQSNLALTYLAMPLVKASDRLRAAIAIQSLREALRVYQKETHPDQWASAQMNLANAMQYLPGTHPQENLEQAVELYEEILAVRNPQTDPIGYARLLANQANALAHLGIFNHAIPKLQQAHALFMRNKEREAADATLELLNQIHNRQRELLIQNNQS
ncbi:MAG: hypothetical protein U0694_09305 [Anaerolineae bacterium]